MNDTAAHLVDRALPRAPYRQWVLSYPRRLRLHFARDAALARDSATLFLREVFRWQRAQARKLSVGEPRVGAVCFTQRFGSRLDLNVHHHAVLPDGVFTLDENGAVRLVELPRPSEDELAQMLARIVGKTLALIERRDEREDVDALGAVQLEAVQATFAGMDARPRKKMSAFAEGFSLEAGTQVNENDRPGLEHLCRYGLRPPLATERLSIAPEGRVVIELKRPMYDGTTEVAYPPVAFVRRLAAIVPPPRAHLTRYFGVFAPASQVRVSAPAMGEESSEPQRAEPTENRKRKCVRAGSTGRPCSSGCSRSTSGNHSRDFVLHCDKCGGRRKVVAFIPSGERAREIFERLAIDATAPPLARAREPARAARLGRLRRTGPPRHPATRWPSAGRERCPCSADLCRRRASLQAAMGVR